MTTGGPAPVADRARFVTAPAVYFTDVAVDGAGNLYAIGSFNGDAAVDETPIASRGPLTMFLASLDRDGGTRWVTAYGGTGRSARVARRWGTFAGDLSIGGIALSGRGGNDGLVARFDRDGATRWARSWGGAAADNGTAIAVDPAGGVAVAGTFTGEADLLVDSPVSTDGNPDLFVLGLNDDGEPRWLHVAGGAGAERVFGLASDPDGGLVVGGRFTGTTALAGAEASSQTGDGGNVYRLRR